MNTKAETTTTKTTKRRVIILSDEQQLTFYKVWNESDSVKVAFDTLRDESYLEGCKYKTDDDKATTNKILNSIVSRFTRKNIKMKTFTGKSNSINVDFLKDKLGDKLEYIKKE